MELAIFGRFHAREGQDEAIAQAIMKNMPPTREEPGCLIVNAFRAIKDPRLFYIHSIWKDEAVFERHAELPHTVRLLETVEPLIDHPFDIYRTRKIC